MSIDLSLDRICKLLAHLPVPYTRPTIHVAGTNGKGSVCALVTSILSNASPPLVVGRFNSPHLLSPRDSICIKNTPTSIDTFLSACADIHRTDAEHEIEATSFERLTCAALLIFERAKVDVVVLEVGMGGRLDATNVVPDEFILVSALTAVDLDHQAFLGDTVEKITREKAAIARRGKPFVLGPQVYPQVKNIAQSVVDAVDGDVLPVCTVTPTTSEKNLVETLHPTETGIRVPLLHPVQISIPPFSDPISALLPLHGEHQTGNLGTAAGIISALLTHPSCQSSNLGFRARLTPEGISRGIQATRWPGRLSYHTISLPSEGTTHNKDTRILVLADGAHNPASATALAAYLSSTLTQSGGRPLTLPYILALSHSPPKTPAQTLEPLFAMHASLSQHREVRPGVALLPFTPPAGMPWIRFVPPADIRAAIDSLAPNPSVEVWEYPKYGEFADMRAQTAPSSATDELTRTDHVEDALRWAARRQGGDRGGEDALVVLAGSLYLVADFYRLLEKLGQAQEIWGAD